MPEANLPPLSALFEEAFAKAAELGRDDLTAQLVEEIAYLAGTPGLKARDDG